MKLIHILFGALFLLLLSSCVEEGEITIQNNVSNVRLEDISYGDYSIYQSLLPGEKSDIFEIQDFKESFPKSHQVEFYMVGNGNRVYLKTKDYYELNYDQTLNIVISESTEVLNPLME